MFRASISASGPASLDKANGGTVTSDARAVLVVLTLNLLIPERSNSRGFFSGSTAL